MSPMRLRAAFDVEFWHSFRRPLFISLAIFLALTAFGLASGKMSISSGESTVGGTKSWITSEFAQTQMTTYLVVLYYSFFIAVSAGLALLKDRDAKVDAILHSTPMTAAEYVWGRFLAVVASFIVVMLWQAAMLAFFNHAVPNSSAIEIRGPFSFANYLTPALMIGVPFVVFYTGVSMYVGERTRNAVMVFVLPVATLLICGFFLWSWSPSWLSPGWNRVMQVLDASGYRWLNETYLKVDRGVQFYNTQRVPYDGLFWINRLWLLVIGLGAVLLTQRSVAASARGHIRASRVWRRGGNRRAAEVPAWSEATGALRGLGMKTGATSFLASLWTVARSEMRELRRQPGLYIFVPIILIQSLGNALLAVGAFDTPLLLTPGTGAVQVANQATVLVCLLLMFYTIESLERERATGFAQILFATPLGTASFLFGKAVANVVVVLVVMLASLAACAITVLVQHTVSFSFTPFLLIWGALGTPTFLAWSAFVLMAYAAVGNRYGAYALCLGAMFFTGYKALTGGMSWAGNWPLFGVMRWSDLGFFENDFVALMLNRAMALGLAVLCAVIAVRLFRRRAADAVRTMHRLAPSRLARSVGGVLPYAVVPAAACIALVFVVDRGVEGGVAKKDEKNYWAKNLKTWFEAPLPDIARVDVAVKVDPAKHWLSSDGRFTLVNPLDSAMAQIPLTVGRHWKNVSWTMNGAEYKPEDSQHLFVFTPPHPLATGDSVVIGWKFDGKFLEGVTRNGGNTDEFILPSGVVMTGFRPTFMPVLGFMEQVGETEKNTTEPKRYRRDYYRGITRGGYGATAWFPARIAITGPEEYTLNSVGVCTANTVKDGWRTQVWETDHPVKILNIVCGRWSVKQGEQSTVYYHPGHEYNLDEISSALDASRRWYSQWFTPYPWRELKLSEFPGLAGYAQGFGTNITFSENIGFLTRNTAQTDATFLVTAHEAAHQWWGNILTPANGPNGDFLSEGAAHFATLLLFEQVKGPRGRMEFAKGIEARYNDRRRADDERAMYDVDGKRRYDNTIIYDRGGWVFWMLYDFLGHERAMQAYHDFFNEWSTGRDHPALQDFVAAMRRYAPDTSAYDAFAKQWFEDKVVPQYQVRDAARKARAGGYDVTCTLTNVGTGTMPVEVAATAGERWKKPASGERNGMYTVDPAYREARATVVLGAGESRTITIPCDFEPANIVVDPDVRVLQLKRKQAVASL